jgi:putative oxidoreductase
MTTIQRYAIVLRDFLRNPFLLFIRVYWGYQFIQTGWGKLQHLDKTTEFFMNLGIPFPHVNAVAVGLTELIGGALLALGAGFGVASVPLVVILAMAYLTDDHEALASIFSDPDKFVAATPFPFLFANIVVMLWGTGDWSVDGLIGFVSRIRSRRTGARAEAPDVHAVA